jgi:hypothetical protein
MDAKKLREAIAVAERWQTADHRDTVTAILEAARAHLATLPKTKMVKRWLVTWESAAGLPAAQDWTTEGDAGMAAQERRSMGRRCVNIIEYDHLMPDEG